MLRWIGGLLAWGCIGLSMERKDHPYEPQIGAVYKHRKGGRYLVLCVAANATNSQPEVPMVVYLSLLTGKVFTRERDEWLDIVDDGRPRFEREA